MFSTPGSSTGAKTPRKSATYYKVRQGDSLYLIAKRLKVPMKTLQNWNPKAGKAIKPGQTLTLYSAD